MLREGEDDTPGLVGVLVGRLMSWRLGKVQFRTLTITSNKHLWTTLFFMYFSFLVHPDCVNFSASLGHWSSIRWSLCGPAFRLREAKIQPNFRTGVLRPLSLRPPNATKSLSPEHKSASEQRSAHPLDLHHARIPVHPYNRLPTQRQAQERFYPILQPGQAADRLLAITGKHGMEGTVGITMEQAFHPRVVQVTACSPAQRASTTPSRHPEYPTAR
jgi:hypothetical protein